MLWKWRVLLWIKKIEMSSNKQGNNSSKGKKNGSSSKGEEEHRSRKKMRIESILNAETSIATQSGGRIVSNDDRSLKQGHERKCGFWSPAEHMRFLQALGLFSRADPYKISDHIGTRNCSQIRSHYQKFNNRIKQQVDDMCKALIGNDGGDEDELDGYYGVGLLCVLCEEIRNTQQQIEKKRHVVRKPGNRKK